MTEEQGDGWKGRQDPLIGKLVAGRFRVKALLGEGGVGRVYEAEHAELRRRVALKVLHEHLGGQEAMRARFLREARSASMLNHPGSVAIHDFGEWEGRLFLAMEFLAGENLADVSQREFPLTSERIVELLGQLCSVLEAAHRIELVHRDLKPENIVLVHDFEGREKVKVVDFGLAKLLDPEQADMRLTRDGMVSGTPDYMSPEQARGHEVDHRSDLYSVGVILYELLCNRTPFAGQSPMDVMLAHIYATPTPPSHLQRASDTDKRLEQIALWAVSKSPGDRPQSATELHEALLDVTGGELRPARGADQNLDREARAKAAGLRKPTGKMLALKQADEAYRLIVTQPPGLPFTESATGPLRAAGHEVVELSSLDELAARIGDVGGDALVLDLRPDAAAALDVLAAQLGALGDRPALVVGPDDDFDSMSRALTVGSSDYVPISNLTAMPAKIERAVNRARRRAKKKKK